MITAVIPQISAAPQPPRSSTDQPSDPSKKPGFARQITNPSYQRSVFRSWRSSTTAVATLYLHLVGLAARRSCAASERNIRRTSFQSTSSALQWADEEAADHDQLRV